MDTETLSGRVAALREECARLGRELVESGRGLSVEEAFGLAGAAQGLANAADAVVAVAGAWGARVETTVRSGSWERVHPLGFRRRDGRDPDEPGDRADRGAGRS
ncbi:hypothetical protein [Arthrobacter sp. NEB 688]|uniref:hypothetical protein n=1 Tax=Arthrobacter sp. NEB 688 TaxID=904039 RepID=UPI001566296C|nr:hypothetical protein [Arthrobacter sp. NEB 688]QKE84744.1 hypothetical protein HL663_12900 [Arthrobacter sp. NEB 688]